MGRLTDWFTIEVERRLAGRMPGPELAEILGEVESHLRDSAEDLANVCGPADEPEALAVERFGSADRFASEILLLRDRRPYWRKAAPLALWMTAMTLLAAATLLPSVRPARDDVLWLCTACGLAAGWVSAKAGRIQFGALASGAGLSFALLMVLVPWRVSYVEGSFMDRGQVLTRLADLRSQERVSRNEVALFDRGRLAFAQGDPAAVPAEFRRPQGFVTGPDFESARRAPQTNLPIVSLAETRALRMSYGDPDDARFLVAEGIRPVLGMAVVKSFDDAASWWRLRAPILSDEAARQGSGLPTRIAELETVLTESPVAARRRAYPLLFGVTLLGLMIASAIHVASVFLGRYRLAGARARRGLA